MVARPSSLTVKLERFKGIAAYIESKVGFPVTEKRCQKWADAERADPLPIEAFGGYIVADADAVDAWIVRQWGRRRGKIRSH
jgi:hypothetical protein